jgi:hypothetical protein
MKVFEILREHFVNLVTPEQRRPHAGEVWALLTHTYSKYGSGLSGAELENLITTPGIWKVSRKNGKMVAGIIYRDSYGRKVRLVFHDDTREGKSELKSILTADVTHGRSWGEFSGNLERLMINLGGKPIPNTEVERILGQKILELDPDGYHYTREVSPGVVKQQILIGNVSQQ